MRDYLVEGLPYRAAVSVEHVPEHRLPRISELSLKVLAASGSSPDAPDRKNHLHNDVSQPPRATAMLIANQEELRLGQKPPLRELNVINRWLFTLPDEALHRLMQACVDRNN
jgi:hypothetical protein